MPSVWHCRATGMARLCQPCGKYVRPLFLYMKHPFLLVWLTLIVLCGCTSSGKQKRHVIGLSQCMLDDAWREAMINDMRIEASNYDDVEIIIKDAQNNNETQIQQIRDLIRQKVDVLIISPYQSEPYRPTIVLLSYGKKAPPFLARHRQNLCAALAPGRFA